MSVPTVTVTDLPAQPTFLDVREDFEWEAGHIDGALHIPLGQLMERYHELPMDDEIVVVCRSGGRSSRAVEWLNTHGLDTVNMAGGMGAWMDAELPMVSENGQEPFVK